MNRCDHCRRYTTGVTDQQRHAWRATNIGTYATVVCNLRFPRGSVDRQPPHPTMAQMHCFQFEEQSQMKMEEVYDGNSD